jgi:hypothetical protein
MNEHITARKMTELDWAVLASFVGIFTLVPFGYLLPKTAFSILKAAYAAIFCALVLVWMKDGGARSPLWKWLPPFLPSGLLLRSSSARWAFVWFFVLGVMAGVIAMFRAEILPR